METRRRLPHIHHIGRPVFVTWRLYGSFPAGRHFDGGATAGRAFAAMDRVLDRAATGPTYLRMPEIAQVVVDAIAYNGHTLGQYEQHAWVIMPNHVHLLITPKVELPTITQSLKGITARRANNLLKTTGKAFWQQESYDHEVLNDLEFRRITAYIENNPVKAGLVASIEEYPWCGNGA